jgi:cyclopropane fatty-acyl-phospholipid synthase-like methyltransferase
VREPAPRPQRADAEPGQEAGIGHRTAYDPSENMPRRRFQFDSGYYDRFYRDPATRVTTGSTVMTLAAFVAAYLEHIGQPVRNVLDIGCGLGLWQPAVERFFPGARYTGVEFSEHTCEEYGWEQGSVVDYRPRRRADLVVCQGVLQYLGDRDCRLAIANLARMCRGALYLEVLTARDWEENCDRDATDGSVYLRSAAFYRKQLAEHFVNCGGGVFLAEESPATLFELERLD